MLSALVLASCFGDGTGPGELRLASVNIAPQFDRSALLAVDVNRVLIRFTLPGTATVAYDTVVDFPANTDTLDLNIRVPVSGGSQQFDMTLLMIDDPAADTVFRAGPILVTATVGTPSTVATPPLVYVGVGANAVGVRFVTAPAQVFFGGQVSFVAEAFDASNATIANTPLVWRTSDPTRASLPDPTTGTFVGGTARGTATITAGLLVTVAHPVTPPSASVPLVVQPVANAVVVQGGSGQTGAVGVALAQPVTVRVNAADGLGVQGVTVNFAVTSGGGTLSAGTAITNATGDASIAWTLGPTLGAQAVGATVAGLTGVSVPATGTVGPAVKLGFVQAPTNGTAGFVITPTVTVAAQDLLGNTVTGFTGTIALAIGANPGGSTLSGTTSAAAASGVATFSGLTLSNPGTGYTLVASAAGLTSATSATFNMISNAPAQLAFVVQPTQAFGGATIAPPVQVEIRNAGGALVTTATNTVTIAIGNNPGGGTLSGTVSVAAVAGIATFSSLSIDLSGTGYTLSATSPTLAAATSTAFDIIAGTPQTLQFTVSPALVNAGGALTPAPVVRVRDALGNTVTSFTGNVTLAFGANPGGATLSGTLTVAAVAGVATFTNVVVSGFASGYTLVASAGALNVTSGAFDVAPPGTTKTWRGGTAGALTDWNNLANWQPAGVPGVSDNVFVPSSAVNQPVQGASGSIGALTLTTGATLSITSGNLVTTGSVTALGAISGGGALLLNGTGQAVQGSLPRTNVNGTVTAAANVTVAGGLNVAGTLNPGSNTITVTGNFSTTAGGVMVMNTAGGVLTVLGNASFAGVNAAGAGTAGTMNVAGDLIQTGVGLSFVQSGTFRTVLTGGGAQTISFGNPGAAANRLQHLDIAKSGGSVTLNSGLHLAGDLTISGGSLGGGGTVTVAGTLSLAAGTGVTAAGVILGGTLGGPGLAGLAPITMEFAGAGQAIPAATWQNLVVSGSATLGGTTLVTGNFTISGPAGSTTLTLAGQTMTVNGSLTTASGGVVVAANPADLVIVKGDANFGGTGSGAPASAGTLRVAGNLHQIGTAATFLAQGTHLTILDGTAAQSVLFDNPGTGTGQSRFQDLQIANTAAPITLLSNIAATGQLRSAAGTETVNGGGNTISVAGLDVDGLVLDNAPLSSTGGTLARFDNVTFQGYAATATPLTITHDGAATPFSFNNDQWLVTPTTGRYLDVVDANPGDGLVFTINLSGTTPPDGSLQTGTSGGAIVSWPAATVVRTWTGAVSTNWFVAGNWAPAGVPAAGEDVTIPAGAPNAATLTAAATIRNLTMANGADLITNNSLTVTGNMNTGLANIIGGSFVNMTGASATLVGRFGADFRVAAGANVSLGSGVVASGGSVTVNGNLTLAGRIMVLNGNLLTQGAGTITMTNPADSLAVGGNASFQGGDETGKLTAGVIGLQGNFSQGSNSQSFRSTGTLVRLVQGLSQSVAISANGVGQSQFAGLIITKTAGSVNFVNAAPVRDSLVVGSATTVTGQLNILGRLVTVAGSTFQANIVIHPDSLFVGGTYDAPLTTFNAGATLPVLTYHAVTVNTGAAVAFAGPVTLSGAGSVLTVSGAGTVLTMAPGTSTVASGVTINNGGRLVLNNTTLNAAAVNLSSGGLLTMQHAADVLSVGGAVFGGGDETGQLTAGRIDVSGPSFDQLNNTSPNSFVSTGTRVRLTNGGFQNINFATPGLGASHFHDVEFAVNGGFWSWNQPLFATGQLVVNAGATTLFGNGHAITVAGLDVNGLTLDNSSLISTGGTITQFDNVTLQNHPVTATPLVIAHPGAATPFTFNNVQWLVTPSSGHYLDVTDNVADANVLTIDLVGSNPGNGSTETGLGGGAVVNWPVAASVRTWAGTTSTNWSDGANWVGGVVPGASDDVVIPAGAPNQPALAAGGATVSNLTVATGASLDVGTQTLTATGNVSAGQSIIGTGQLTMSGTSKTVQGDLPNLVISGTVSLAGPTNAVTITVSGAGALFTVNGQPLTISGDLQVLNDGRLAIRNSADSVNVLGNALFAGGDEAGQLTIGVLVIHGSFTQNPATSSNSFVSTGTRVRMAGTGTTQSVTFNSSTPTTSRLADLIVESSAGRPVQLGFFTATDSVVIATAVNVTPDGSGGFMTIGGKLKLVAGSSISASALRINADSIQNAGTLNLTFNHFTGGTIPAGTYNRVVIEGSAAFAPGAVVMQQFTVTGSGVVATLNGPTTAALFGRVDTGAELILNGHTMVTQQFNAFSAGLLTMTNAADSLEVSGLDVSSGGNSTGHLAAGVIHLAGGGLTASGATSFVSSGTRVRVTGGSTQSVGFAFGNVARHIVVNKSGGTLSFGSATVADSLVIQSPTTVTGATLTITGRLVTASGSDFQGATTIHADSMFIGGTYSGGITFTGGASLPVHTYRNVTVSTGGASAFAGPVALQPGFGLTVNNGTVLTVSGSGVTTSAGGGVIVSGNAELVLNNGTVTTSSFNSSGGGLLSMQHSTDQLIVNGTVNFDGGDETGRLTDGLISLTGSFLQTATTSGMSFVSTGTRVRFTGTGTQNILFATPGPGAGASHFMHLELANSGTFSYTQNLFANGQLRSPAGATAVVSNGSTLNVAGLDVDGLTLTNAHIASTGGTITRFDNVTFTGYGVTATPLVVAHPGAVASFTFDNVQWLVTPTTGQYLSVTDNAADANGLTIDLANTAFDGSLLTGTAGGAAVNWQVVAAVRTWTGATSGDWFDPANWSGNAVPTTSNDVVIPAGTANAVSLSAPFSIKGLTVAAGVTLNLSAADVTTTGNVDVQGSIINGNVRMSGASPVTLVGGPIENVEVRGGDVSAAGNVTIGAVGLDVNQPGGIFRVGSNTVTIGGHLNVTNDGLLDMTSTGSVVNVTGNVMFAGGDETGSLADGLLTVGGNFNQFNATTPNSFVSTGTSVRFTNTTPRSVLFDTPGSANSRFQQVEFTGSGSVTFTTDAFITGDLTMSGSGAVQGPGHLNVAGDVNKTSGSLGVDGLNLGGALNYAFGGFGVNTTTFAGTNQVIPIGFIYANVGITGTGATIASGTWSIAGGLTVSAGDLTIAAANTVTMAGLTVTGGVLNQTGGNITASNVAFGGTTSGTLSGGTLMVGGNFTQSGGNGSFAPTGTHRVILQGINSTLTFSSPGLGLGLSHFNELELQGTAANLAQNVFVGGQLSGGGGHVLHGNGHTLTVAGIDVDGLTFDNALLNSNGGTLVSFNNVIFQGHASTATPLTISHPGGASPITFDNVAWQVTPTGPGRYLNLTDDDGGNGLTLALDLTNSSPGDGSPQTTLTGGALVFWPLLANWTGATSTDWSVTTNWSGGNVPGPASNALVLPGTPNAPVLSAPASVHNLTVVSGATVGLGAHNLTVNGDVAVAGAVTASGGNLVMAGTGKTLGGAVPGLLITGTVFAIQPVTINGLVDVSGTFDLGTSVTVNGDFQTTPSGLLSMVNPAAQLTINGNAVFTGLDETTLLTQGFIEVTGNFSQQSIGSNMSFASAGTDLRLIGTAPQTVDMQAASPFLSHLAALEINKGGGSVTFSGNILVMDSLLVASPTTISGAGTAAVFRKVITAAGSDLQFDGLSVDPDSLQVGGAWNISVTVFTGGGAVPAFNYNNLVFGPGSYSTTTALNPATLTVNTVATLTLGADLTAGIVSMVGGELVVNGHTVVATTGLVTQTGGLLTMTNPADSVAVPGAGTISFDGGDQTGRLTAGVIAVGGHFVQGPSGDPRSFASTGTRVRFNGTGDQSVSFFNPGFADSRFAGVIVDKPSNGMTFNTNAFIIDSLEVVSSTDLLGSGSVYVGRKARTQSTGNFAMSGLTVHADSLLISPQTTYGVATTLFNGGGSIPVLTFGSVTVATGSATTLPAMTLGGDLTVSGSGTDLTLAPGTHTINGPLTVEGTNSRLRVNGATATMFSLTTQFEGVLDMTAGGLLTMTGNARFDGGDETLLLTAGKIQVEGDFTQVSTTSARSFVSQGTTIELNGGGTQPVSFQSTLGTDSRFGSLLINKTGGNVTLTGNAFVTESLLVNSPTDVDGGNWFVTRKLSTIVGSNFEPASLEMNSDSLFVLGAFDLAQVSTVRFVDGNNIPGLGYTNLIVQSGGPMAMTGGALLNASLQVVGSQLTLFNGGTVAVNGSVSVSGAGADLILNGSTLIVNQALTVSAGTLTMTDPADVVIAAGNASFSSSNSTGHLTAGDLSVEGNFDATGANAFVASGTHKTLFQGTLNQSINFTVPGPLTTGSHFNHLQVSGTGGVTLTSNVFADGQLIDQNPTAESITGTGTTTLQVAGADVDNMTMAGLGVVIDNTAVFTKFDNVTWTSGPTAGAMLEVRGNGNQTRTFNGLTFPAANPAPVNYLASCWMGVAGTPFTVTLVTPNPIGANNFGQVDNTCGPQGTALTVWP